LVADNRVWFGKSGNNVPRRKAFASEAKQGLTPHTLWTAEEVGTNDSAKKELIELFGGREVFDTPKPASLIRRMLEIATDKSDLVLDFFAGSAPTAQAVLGLNQADGGQRKFILVQLPERTDLEGFSTIAEVTKERVRLAIERIKAAEKGPDLGFRVFKLAGPSFTRFKTVEG